MSLISSKIVRATAAHLLCMSGPIFVQGDSLVFVFKAASDEIRDNDSHPDQEYREEFMFDDNSTVAHAYLHFFQSRGGTPGPYVPKLNLLDDLPLDAKLKGILSKEKFGFSTIIQSLAWPRLVEKFGFSTSTPASGSRTYTVNVQWGDSPFFKLPGQEALNRTPKTAYAENLVSNLRSFLRVLHKFATRSLTQEEVNSEVTMNQRWAEAKKAADFIVGDDENFLRLRKYSSNRVMHADLNLASCEQSAKLFLQFVLQYEDKARKDLMAMVNRDDELQGVLGYIKQDLVLGPTMKDTAEHRVAKIFEEIKEELGDDAFAEHVDAHCCSDRLKTLKKTSESIPCCGTGVGSVHSVRKLDSFLPRHNRHSSKRESGLNRDSCLDSVARATSISTRSKESEFVRLVTEVRVFAFKNPCMTILLVVMSLSVWVAVSVGLAYFIPKLVSEL